MELKEFIDDNKGLLLPIIIIILLIVVVNVVNNDLENLKIYKEISSSIYYNN